MGFVAADAGWLVAFAWAVAADRRLAEQPVPSGLELDLGPASCRDRRDRRVPATAARLARGGERASGGEARERQRIPACRLSSFLRSIESQQGLCRGGAAVGGGFLPTAFVVVFGSSGLSLFSLF